MSSDTQARIDVLLEMYPEKRELSLDLIDRGYSVDRIWSQYDFERKKDKEKNDNPKTV